jgi:thiosulfate/3-mercaptopyruvate sulfurtransferase
LISTLRLALFKIPLLVLLSLNLVNVRHTYAENKVTFRRVLNARQVLTFIDEQRSKAKESGVTLLDARDLYPKYYLSHAVGAQHTPWRSFTIGRKSGVLKDLKSLQNQMESLGIHPQKPVIIYGDWERGWGEEARMLWLLEYLGHTQVYVVEGGWAALTLQGMSSEWGRTQAVKRSVWSLTPDLSRRADTQAVEGLLARGVLSFDARSKREFEGETPYGSTYGGHFPKSIHVPWKSLLTVDHKLKTIPELREYFLSLGAHIDQPIFTYCTGGIRSAFVYLALREAGFDQAVNYDGSWWAWTSTHAHTSNDANHE